MNRDTERRRGTRFHAPEQHGVTGARVRPGHAVDVIDVSAGGALIQTERRLLPGSTIDLHLTTADGNVAMRGRVVRCSVARVRPSSVSYRGAISFERHLPWFAEEDDVAGGPLGNEVHARRAGRASGSPSLVG